MKIQSTNMSVSSNVNFGNKRPINNLPEMLRVKNSRSVPKGLYIVLVQIALFLTSIGVWRQTPQYKFDKLTKDYHREYSKLAQDSTNKQKLDSLTLEYLIQSAELLKEINKNGNSEDTIQQKTTAEEPETPSVHTLDTII